MNAELWGLAGVIVTAAVAYFGHRMMRPKILAEARKAEAEAISLDWARFQAEIERLELKIAAQDEKIAALDRDRRAVAVIADEREAENKLLRAKLAKLEKRLTAIEALFKLHPITPELQADLDRLNKEH